MSGTSNESYAAGCAANEKRALKQDSEPFFVTGNFYRIGMGGESMEEDIFFMRRALDLARRGEGRVNPNPLVGAVVVRDGMILGEGWHETFGGLHAERNALLACGRNGRSEKGATLYVTLEPCCHWGKTPPCTDAVIEKGIGRVVVGSLDPNPLVAGKGLRLLREAGIAVETGVLQEQCEEMNKVFFHYIKEKTPYVTMKYAMTMDGKTATVAGHSKWITESPARVRVHEDRNRHMAIMTGVGSVIADDPMLSCRIPDARQPIRLICDTHLRTRPKARVVRTAAEQPTWILTCCAEKERQEVYQKQGCRILEVEQKDGHVDLEKAMELLGGEGIDSVYLEGGSKLNASALEAGIVQGVHCYIAPKLFGGETAKTPVGGSGVTFPDQARQLTIRKVTSYGNDLLLECGVRSGGRDRMEQEAGWR